MTQPSPLLATLPNGKSLPFALPGERLSPFQYWRDRSTETFNRRVKEASQLPILSLWNSFDQAEQSNLCLIAADFDRVPDNYDSFEHLHAKLSWELRDHALVFRSRSGRVKALLLVECGDIHPHRLYRETLRKYFSDEFDGLDLQETACRATFITPSLLEELPRLAKLKPVFACYDDLLMEDKPFQIFEGELPVAVENFISGFRAEPGAIEKLCRMLLATPQLLEAGFELPTTKLAQLYGLDQQQVSRVLHKLVTLGWLEEVNSKYIPGRHAKKYRAKGALADLLRAVHTQRPETALVPSQTLPDAIAPGQWNAALLKAVWQFKTEEVFLRWVAGVEGFEAGGVRKQKERLSKAQDLWASHLNLVR